MAKKTEKNGLGVPCMLLKEFMDRKITIETNSGDIYRGIVNDVEGNMSMMMDKVRAISSDGTVEEMESIYIRGSRIRVITLPDSAADYLPKLSLPPMRKRGGFRGGRGGMRGGGKNGYGGGSSKPSYGRR